MTIPKYAFSLLVAIAFVPVGASANESPKVVVKGKHDPSTVVVKGVRDPSSWFRIESQHLIVYSNDDPDDVIELVNNIERLDYLLRLYLKPFLDRQETMPKLTLYFQNPVNWPLEIGEHSPSAVGMVNSCVSATQAFTYEVGKSWKLNNSSLLRADDDYTLMANLWLYAENFLYRHTRIRAPTWFIVGFQAYFAGVRFTDTQMAIGRDAGTSYNWVQMIDEGKAGARLSFDQVFNFKSPSKSYKVGTADYFEQYEFMGRAFNLVHYMLSSEENRNKTAKYLDLVNNGSDSAEAFAEVFGLSGRDLDAAMLRYRRGSLKILQVDVPELPKGNIDFTRLSRIEGEFVIDNALLKTCPTPADGRKLLERLKLTAPKASAVGLAQITLSRAQVEWGNPREAIGYLSRAVEDDPYNPEPHYLLGLAYAKLAERAGPNKQDLLESARAGLTQAAVLAPDAPEISYALFRVGLMGASPTRKDIVKGTEAWHHGHDVTAFARAAALAYAWLGNAADAYQTFNTLVRSERDRDTAAWAASWLAKLEKGVTQDELLAAMRSENPALPNFRSWISDSR
ncbi:tetratricopeptide repeat protein [Massilia sp. GER05]|uniref:tetratricopeptide repeat protein n=1 Tax=Massilia sp. GER05 TaxID=3394605 RepID=UPI003F84B5E5